MKIQVLTSKNSWLFENKVLIKKGNKIWNKVNIITDYKKINKKYDAVVMLSYYKILPDKFLNICKYNFVVHESDLPKGRGFSPLYKQIQIGKKKITFSLFECSKKMDQGKIYLKKNYYFKKTLIYDEIKVKQIECAKNLIETFIKKNKKKKIFPTKQKGRATYFGQFKSTDSQLNPKKSILSQFNKMRIKNNNKFPSFFFINNKKFILKLYKQ